MSYILQYLVKQPSDLTYDEIEHFFSVDREESDKIEFKSYHSPAENEKEKENGILRSACAFLNSSGGLIIWGAPVGQAVEGKKEKIFKGALSPVTKLIEKDYIINRLTDSITPSPNSINFYSFEKNGSYVNLIEIGQSEYRPHQYKNTYYMRIDGQTKPAPHHYIEALFKRISYPKLKGYITFNNLTTDRTYFYLEISAIIFNLSKLQIEHRPYFRIVVTKGATFQESHNPRLAHLYSMSGHELRKANATETIYYNQPYRFTETLRLNPTELIKHNSEFSIWFYFGGENSPLLLSKYTLKIDFTHPNVQDLNTLISHKDENRYFFEHSDDLGKTEEERIKAIIGR